MSSYPISGIDVSKWQGNVDFGAVYESGQSFAICKATEGSGYVDPRFMQNWERLMELDGELIRGAYHFARPDSVGGASDGKAEASDFCDVLEAVGGHQSGAFAPALDYEKYSGKGIEANLEFIRAFRGTVEDRIGRSPIIYTGYQVWGYQTGNTAEFTDLALWLVNYSRAAFPETAMAKLPWKEFAMWQWSGGAKYAYGDPVPGIPGGVVDLNRFNGSEEDLWAMALHTPEKPIVNVPARPDLLTKLLCSAEADLELGIGKVRAVRQALEKALVA
jgi:lysozyme